MHCLRVWMQGPLVCIGWETPVTFNGYQCLLTFWLVVLFDISYVLYGVLSLTQVENLWNHWCWLIGEKGMGRIIEKTNTGFLAPGLWNFPFAEEVSLIHGRIIEANLPAYNICDLLLEWHWHWDVPQETCILRNKELVKNIALAFLCALDTEKAVGRTTCNFFCKYYLHCCLSLTVWER